MGTRKGLPFYECFHTLWCFCVIMDFLLTLEAMPNKLHKTVCDTVRLTHYKTIYASRITQCAGRP